MENSYNRRKSDIGRNEIQKMLQEGIEKMDDLVEGKEGCPNFIHCLPIWKLNLVSINLLYGYIDELKEDICGFKTEIFGNGHYENSIKGEIKEIKEYITKQQEKKKYFLSQYLNPIVVSIVLSVINIVVLLILGGKITNQ